MIGSAERKIRLTAAIADVGAVGQRDITVVMPLAGVRMVLDVLVDGPLNSRVVVAERFGHGFSLLHDVVRGNVELATPISDTNPTVTVGPHEFDHGLESVVVADDHRGSDAIVDAGVNAESHRDCSSWKSEAPPGPIHNFTTKVRGHKTYDR